PRGTAPAKTWNHLSWIGGFSGIRSGRPLRAAWLSPLPGVRRHGRADDRARPRAEHQRLHDLRRLRPAAARDPRPWLVVRSVVSRPPRLGPESLLAAVPGRPCAVDSVREF